MYLADRLARYAHELRYEELDAATVEAAKDRILDALGCAMGAFDEEPVRIARRAVLRSTPRGSATLFGTKEKTSPDLATFVNGLMVRYFDFNDTYLSKEPAHPSDNLGACLAVAESEGSSGRELLVAMVLAYEVQCRLCDAADIRHRGWDHVCYGLVSSALAAGRLMGLSEGELTQAVNISLNSHIAMRQVRAGELSMWKGVSFSNATRNAVFSAGLAREGMVGPAPIFEGEMGFFRQVSGPFELDVSRFGGRGRPFRILDTYIKYFPAEYHSQSAIWAALDLRRKLKDPGEVESVLVETQEAGYTILAKDPEKWAPKTKETADHSLPYIVGMALLDGRIDNDTYSDGNLRNPTKLAFVRKVKVLEDDGLTSLYPDRGIANRVTVRLRSGRTLKSQVNVPRGHAKNPMTSEEVENKFTGLAGDRLTKEAAKKLLAAIRSIEDLDSVAVIAPLLKARKP